MPRPVTLDDGTTFDLDAQADALIQHVLEHPPTSFVASRIQRADALLKSDPDDVDDAVTSIYYELFTLAARASAPVLSQVPRRELEPLMRHATQQMNNNQNNNDNNNSAANRVLVDVTMLWLRKHVHLVQGALSLQQGALYAALAQYMVQHVPDDTTKNIGSDPTNNTNDNDKLKLVFNLLWVLVWTVKRHATFSTAVLQLEATGFLGQCFRCMAAICATPSNSMPDDLQQHLLQILTAMMHNPTLYSKLQPETDTGKLLQEAAQQHDHQNNDHPLLVALHKLAQGAVTNHQGNPTTTATTAASQEQRHVLQTFLTQNHVPIAIHMILAQQLWEVPRTMLLVELDLSLTRKKDFQQPVVVGKISDYLPSNTTTNTSTTTRTPHWWPTTDATTMVHPAIRQRFQQGLLQQQVQNQQNQTAGGLILVRLKSGQEVIVPDRLPHDVYQALAALVIHNDDTALLTKNVYPVELVEQLKTEILPALKHDFQGQQQQAWSEKKQAMAELQAQAEAQGLPDLED